MAEEEVSQVMFETRVWQAVADTGAYEDTTRSSS